MPEGMTPGLILALIALAMVMEVGPKIVRDVKKGSVKTGHAVERIVTFGHCPKRNK